MAWGFPGKLAGVLELHVASGPLPPLGPFRCSCVRGSLLSFAGGVPSAFDRLSLSSPHLQKQSQQAQPEQQQQQEEEGAADSTGDASVPASTLQTAQPAVSCAGGSALACSAAEASAAVPAAAPMAASCGSSDTREGDKEWAALTTWLRMNLHNPRTAKKVVLFVGQNDAASGRWLFDLNPALTWADVSQDTKLRLRDLLSETQVRLLWSHLNGCRRALSIRGSYMDHVMHQPVVYILLLMALL